MHVKMNAIITSRQLSVYLTAAETIQALSAVQGWRRAVKVSEMQSLCREELAVSYRWIGWVQDIIGWSSRLRETYQCFFLTNGPAFHVTANFYIIGFLTGWSYFSMSFDWLAAKVTVTGCHLACDGCKKKPWKLLIVWEESIEYTSNEWKHQNRKISTCN